MGGSTHQNSNSPTKIPDSSYRKVGTSAMGKSDTANDSIQMGQGWQEVQERKKDIEETINNLDDKLNLVLAKQEYEYLKGYNIYVKRKESELRKLIEKLNEKNSNNTLKDEKINNLEKTIQSIRDDQIRMEKEKDEMTKKIKKWQSKSNNFEQERDFLQ